MSDLREIYQEVILDHYRTPRNFSALDTATKEARGHNPLCGDRISVYLVVDDDVVKDVAFQGTGCAISTASASLMTEAVKGKKVEDVRALFHRFHEMMTGREELDHEVPPEGGERNERNEVDLGKLEALSGVRRIPIRVKCATLAWHTLKAALEQNGKPATGISTE